MDIHTNTGRWCFKRHCILDDIHFVRDRKIGGDGDDYFNCEPKKNEIIMKMKKIYENEQNENKPCEHTPTATKTGTKKNVTKHTPAINCRRNHE